MLKAEIMPPSWLEKLRLSAAAMELYLPLGA
jgi:hypothetical protein